MIEIRKTTAYIAGFMVVFLMAMMLVWRNEAIELKKENQLLKMTIKAKFKKLERIEEQNGVHKEK